LLSFLLSTYFFVYLAYGIYIWHVCAPVTVSSKHGKNRIPFMYGDFAFGCIVARAVFIILPFPLTEHWTGTPCKTLLSVHMVYHCGSGICQGCSHICAPKIPFS
jgi:hypothetical protein